MPGTPCRHGGSALPCRSALTLGTPFGHACVCSTPSRAVGGDVTELVCKPVVPTCLRSQSRWNPCTAESSSLLRVPFFNFSHTENDPPAFQRQHLPCAAPCTSLFVHSGPRHGSRTPGHGCLHTTACALRQSTQPWPSVRLTGWHAPARTRQMNWTASCERTSIRDDLVLVTIFGVFFGLLRL